MNPPYEWVKFRIMQVITDPTAGTVKEAIDAIDEITNELLIFKERLEEAGKWPKGHAGSPGGRDFSRGSYEPLPPEMHSSGDSPSEGGDSGSD